MSEIGEDLPGIGIAKMIAVVSGVERLPVEASILVDDPAPVPAIAAVADAGDQPVALSDRKVAAEARLDGLKAGRADALLRGEAVDGQAAAIAGAEAELAAIGDAEQLDHDRRRQAAAEIAARRGAQIRGAITHQAALRLRAVAAAQEAFDRGAGELRRAADALDEIRALAVKLGADLGMPLHANEAANRLSRRIGATLVGLQPGHRYDFGVMKWGSLSAAGFAAEPDWSKGESTATGAAIASLTRGASEP